MTQINKIRFGLLAEFSNIIQDFTENLNKYTVKTGH